MDNHPDLRDRLEMLGQCYAALAVCALATAILTVTSIVRGRWEVVTLSYCVATVWRLLAGGVMNRMGDARTIIGDTKTVNAWNDKHHRYVVIALNSVVGAVLWGRVWWDAQNHESWYMFLFVTAVFMAYFLAAHWTRPNTFGARVRSAALTIVLIETMAYLAFGMAYWGLYIVFGMAVGIYTVIHLAHLADRFGWADR